MTAGRRSVAVRMRAAMAAFAIASFARPAPASVGPVTLEAARIANYRGAMELHFAFNDSAPRFKLHTQGSELLIDLPATTTQLPPRPLFGRETAPVKTIRVMNVGPGKAQIAIEVEGKTDYAIARLKHEIVIRLATAGTVRNLAAPILVRNDEPPAHTGYEPPPSAAQPAAKKVALPPPAPPEAHIAVEPPAPQTQVAMAEEPEHAQVGHPLVMIDPGHGGYDPGTSSVSGLQEKDLALAIALKLQSALQARGFRTEMTRSSDFFVPLPERTKIANRANADLFVSIHLNSSPNPETTGIEVYYLNNTTDHSTIRLAKIENAGAPASYGTDGGPNLNYILTDLRQQYKANESASLARMIDAQAVASLDAGLGTNVNALGAKMGPFYVLVGAHMPSVLVETGFLSNPGEAQRLASPRYQAMLADGIATAIAHYLNADVAVGNL